MSDSTKKIREFIEDKKLNAEVKEIPESTRTAAEAARAIGCKIDEIAKSVIFESESGNPILVIASGSKRINEDKIESEIGKKVHKADANFVKKHTGFSIGGVPPFGHESPNKIKIFIDKDLMDYKKIWAAAGTPNSVFSISPKELVKVSGGKVLIVSKSENL